MKITFLVHPKSWFTADDAQSFMPVLLKHAAGDEITIAPRPEKPGDILFALHYPALIPEFARQLHKHNVVIHAADLPRGRGRSPIHWQVEEGRNSMTLTMFEMGAGADDGPVYLKSTLALDGTELLPDIRQKVILAELDMIDTLLRQWPLEARPQQGEPSYYAKRTREHQRLDVNRTIAEQFDKMRVADNESYPLWFEHRGACYELKIFRANRPS